MFDPPSPILASLSDRLNGLTVIIRPTHSLFIYACLTLHMVISALAVIILTFDYYYYSFFFLLLFLCIDTSNGILVNF